MQRLVTASMLAVLLLCELASAQPPEPAQDYILYEIQESDTLRDLAETYLGGEQYLQELIRYNALVTPSRVKTGDKIVIPLGVRDRAISGLSKAEESLATALTAQADQFASDAYGHALTTLHQAREAREAAAYSRSVALAELAVDRSRTAIGVADKSAPVQQPARLIAASGTVELSLDEGETWSLIKKGNEVPVPSRVRTVGDSRAELQLADKSKVQILEDSTFEVQTFLFDRRDGVRRSRMKVILGSILGRITPKEHDESTFEIETEAAAVAIRGTVLRVGADETQTARLAVLEGLTQLEADGEGLAVPEGFGSVTEDGQASGSLRKLLPAPHPLSPIHEFSTGNQEVTFSWEKVKSKELGSYHFELSTDKGFNHVIYRETLDKTRIQSPVLPEGTYYWRVSSLNKQRLEGKPFAPNMLGIELRLGVVFEPGGTFWQSDDQVVLGRDGYIQVQPNETDSSVHTVLSRTGNGEYLEQGSRLLLKNEGQFTVQAQGVSRTGAKGSVQKVDAVVDLSPPTIKLDLVPVRSKDNLPVFKMMVKSEDNTGVQKTEYSLNSGPFLEYFGPVPLDPYISYDVAVRARDHVGNQSPVQTIHVMAGWPQTEEL